MWQVWQDETGATCVTHDMFGGTIRRFHTMQQAADYMAAIDARLDL